MTTSSSNPLYLQKLKQKLDDTYKEPCGLHFYLNGHPTYHCQCQRCLTLNQLKRAHVVFQYTLEPQDYDEFEQEILRIIPNYPATKIKDGRMNTYQ